MTDELLEYLREIEPKMREQAKGLWAEGVKMAIARIEHLQRMHRSNDTRESYKCLECGAWHLRETAGNQS